jgi:hypothetical protein
MADRDIIKKLAEMDPMGCDCQENPTCVFCYADGWDEPVMHLNCLWIEARQSLGMPIPDGHKWATDDFR